jgi:hypothetical protein
MFIARNVLMDGQKKIINVQIDAKIQIIKKV